MTHIELEDVSVEIPVFDHSGQRLFESVKRGFTRNKEGKESKRVTQISALKNISLSLPAGTRLGVVGSNGSGKTTLLRLLSGVYRETSGSFKSEGAVTSFLDMTFGIEPDLTGREAIVLRSRLLGNSRKTVEEKLEEIIEFSELGRFIDQPTRTYSSGMFLRLAFSISTFLRPEILLMDEWLSVGDKGFRHKAEEKLQEIVQNTSILVIASHSRELIERTCSRAIVLGEGSLLADGTSQEICEQYFGGDAD